MTHFSDYELKDLLQATDEDITEIRESESNLTIGALYLSSYLFSAGVELRWQVWQMPHIPGRSKIVSGCVHVPMHRMDIALYLARSRAECEHYESQRSQVLLTELILFLRVLREEDGDEWTP